jgi:hypothetical protein
MSVGCQVWSFETQLTNNLLKAIMPIHGKAGLTRQFDRVDNIDTHLDHTLHNHIVLLELEPSQLHTMNTPRTMHSQMS